MSEFYSILTTKGLEKLAALVAGGAITLTHMAFGNSTTAPHEDQTELGNEKHRCALTKVLRDGNNPNTITIETIIKGEVGGFWIREVGVFDSDGDLFAVGKYPATYKPLTAEGSVKELGVRMLLRVSNSDGTIITYSNGIIEGANTDLSNLTITGQKKLDDKADLLDMTEKLTLKADLDSPEFTGTPVAPTAAIGTNDTQLATTAFVATAVSDKATIASPAFTGTPSAPTAEVGANTDQLANTAFVQAAIAALVNSSPEALDTLEELAAALGNDPNFATTITNLLASKAAKTGDKIIVACEDPTTDFSTRNIKAQTEDPGVDSELSTGDILLIYE